MRYPWERRVVPEVTFRHEIRVGTRKIVRSATARGETWNEVEAAAARAKPWVDGSEDVRRAEKAS